MSSLRNLENNEIEIMNRIKQINNDKAKLESLIQKQKRRYEQMRKNHSAANNVLFANMFGLNQEDKNEIYQMSNERYAEVEKEKQKLNNLKEKLILLTHAKRFSKEHIVMIRKKKQGTLNSLFPKKNSNFKNIKNFVSMVSTSVNPKILTEKQIDRLKRLILEHFKGHYLRNISKNQYSNLMDYIDTFHSQMNIIMNGRWRSKGYSKQLNDYINQVKNKKIETPSPVKRLRRMKLNRNDKN